MDDGQFQGAVECSQLVLISSPTVAWASESFGDFAVEHRVGAVVRWVSHLVLDRCCGKAYFNPKSKQAVSENE